MERHQPKFQPVKSVRRSLDPRRIRLDLNQRRTTTVYVPEEKRRSVCGGSATNEWTNVEERKVERNGQRDGQTDGRVTQIGSAEAMLRRLGSSIESMVAHHSDVFVVPRSLQCSILNKISKPTRSPKILRYFYKTIAKLVAHFHVIYVL